MRCVAIAVVLVSSPVWAQTPRTPPYANKLAPYVSSPTRVVDRMLELAAIKPGETLYDLGCGDGRVLIAAVEKYNAKAIGVEINPKVAARAQSWIKKGGVESQAHVIRGDLFDVDLTGADVVVIYLARQTNDQLRPRL